MPCLFRPKRMPPWGATFSSDSAESAGGGALTLNGPGLATNATGAHFINNKASGGGAFVPALFALIRSLIRLEGGKRGIRGRCDSGPLCSNVFG